MLWPCPRCGEENRQDGTELCPQCDEEYYDSVDRYEQMINEADSDNCPPENCGTTDLW